MIKAQVRGEATIVIASDIADESWLELRQEANRAKRLGDRLFTCVDCRQPVHPKEFSERGTRWFAHNPGPHGGCALVTVGGESPEHVRLKTTIYQAAKKVAKWDADVEVPTGDVDNDTGKPAVVDVVAIRQGVAQIQRDDRRAFEVQLSALDAGHLLNRQEIRERFASRSTWVTTKRYQWSAMVPWYQVEPHNEQHPDLVVDGVLSMDEDTGECALVPPFEAYRMVGLILGRRMPWIGDLGGFILNYGAQPGGKAPRRSQVQASKSSRVADWCDRPVVPTELAEPCAVCHRASRMPDYSGRLLCHAHFRLAAAWMEKHRRLPTNSELVHMTDQNFPTRRPRR